MSNIERIEAGQHVLQCYMPYAVSTIVDRALPDVRDGLKPIHRRILFQMKKAKMTYDKDRVKSIDSIAQTMKIHHNGNSSVYDAIALMTEQNESLLHPYIDGEGAFGKVYSKDKPTPERYTWCRLNEFAEEFFKDTSNGIITMTGEDEEHMQPVTLSSDFPNILVKNNKGIACGEACDFPSFNLSEVCEATYNYIDNKDINLLDYIKGVDFPTGGYMIYNKNQLSEIYNTGKGKVVLKSKYKYLKEESIIEVNEIPYNTTIDNIIFEVFELLKKANGNSIFKNITDIRDETGFNKETKKEEMKIAIDVKKNTDIDLLMNNLFKKTSLQKTYSANMNCLVNCTPKVMGIKQILNEWIKFRQECIKKTLTIKLEKQKKDFHLLKGLQNVLINTDKCVDIIKKSPEEEVLSNLMVEFNLDELQANYVLDMKLRKINDVSVKKELLRIKAVEEEIKELEDTLNSENGINEIIKKGLIRIKDKYGKPRKTQIIEESEISTISKEELIEDYNCRLIYTGTYLKKYLRQSDSHNVKEGETILGDIETTNKSTLLIFTDKANRYKIHCYELETYTPSKLGDYVYNILPIDKSEQIIKIVSIKEPKGNIYFTYENGNVAKIDVSSFISNNKKLQNCYSTESKLLDIYYSEKEIDIFMLSSEGQGVIISSNSFNSKKSRKSNGDIGIKLTEDNKVIGCILNVTDEYSLKLTAKDYKTKEIYFDDVYSKDDDTQLYKKLKGKGNRNRQGLMIWNMRNYKNNNSIIKCEII